MADEHRGEPISVSLTASEIMLLISALDSHEYWQLGDPLPRNDGWVWIPGDSVDVQDRFWEGRTPTDEQAQAIEAVRECRDLAERLRLATHERADHKAPPSTPITTSWEVGGRELA